MMRETVTIKRKPLEYPPCPEGVLREDHKRKCRQAHDKYMRDVAALIMLTERTHEQLVKEYEAELDKEQDDIS